ncbi:MAG: hypothetical protein AB7V04_13575 [Desulfomonilaceae bacterium]
MKLFLWGTVGWGSNLAVFLRERVDKGHEFSNNVVFCRVATGWNRDDSGLERVHLDVFSRYRNADAFSWNDEEIWG